MSDFSIIVPVFNEEKAVGKFTKTLIRLKEEIKNSFEVIFVNDGSSDNTGNILEKTEMPDNFKIISYKNNRGYGAAIKAGIKKSKSENIVLCDADGSYPIEKIPEMILKYSESGADMLTAERSSGKGSSLARKPAKFFLRKLAEYLAGYRIPDLNSGMRIFKKSLFEKFLKIIPDGFSLTTTITLSFLGDGHRVEYFPIEYSQRKGKSKIRPLRDTLNFLSLILRTIIFFNPLKVFLPVSVLLVFFSLLLFFYAYWVHGLVLDVTCILLSVTSLQLFAIGLLADLINRRLK